ncbi:DUF6997 domain-containing protein [Endozoicomonas lisbonensis]|uniref:DUF6997 domain-containing protein n=1 Tax=Endozoicomonas lisbonensis TaxID=3120522 RepID=A0ABV2SDY7_9GAMM
MFEQAIEKLENSGRFVGKAESFQKYLSSINNNSRGTAEHISINSFKDLKAELRNSNCMVFRLGSPPGSRNTHFALAKTNSGWSDYFFMDEDLFGQVEPEVFLPNSSIRSLFAFQLLPTLTENSLVNLAMASGLLPQALGISSTENQIIPATGQSVFSFDFQPSSKSNETLSHQQGQVEIDAIFVGQRDGKECLFVIEAKSSKKFDSLAKHKLLYPILSIKSNIPSYMEIVPVYLRTIRNDDHIEFNIAECSIPYQDSSFGSLDQLQPVNISRYSLYGY